MFFRGCHERVRRCSHGRRQDFGSGENAFWGRLCGGPGAAEPPERGEFSKIINKFLQKIAKNASFQHIFQNFLTIHASFFRSFGRKTQIFGKNFDKFWKIFKKFLKEIVKDALFQLFFQDILIKVLIFRAFGPQIQMFGNFEKILKIFDENSKEKIDF